jgi:hypothetical protein
MVTVWCVTGFGMFPNTGKSETPVSVLVPTERLRATGLMLNVLLTINGVIKSGGGGGSKVC